MMVKKKEVKKNKIKVCGICKFEIYDKAEDWCQLDTYIKGKFKSTGYYHLQCFREKFKINQRVNDILGKTEQLIEKVL